MKVRDQPEVCGFTIFCDDIRYELGGKISLVGCYGADIIIPGEFPFTLQKLCFSIRIFQRRELLDPNIEVRIYLPGDPDDTPSVSASAKETSEGAVADATAREVEGLPLADQRVVGMTLSLAAAPLVLKERGAIQVRAIRKGKMIRLGGIRVVSQQEMESRQTPLLAG